MSSNKILLSIVTSTLLLPAASIVLDIHVPLPQGCLLTQALRANLLLQQISRPVNKEDDVDNNSNDYEGVDLFTRDVPHVTLYLADFDLETTSSASINATAPSSSTTLNQTKVDSFLSAIESLNMTHLNASSCPLSFTTSTSSSSSSSDGDSFFAINNDKYYKINGAYTMIPIVNTPCLQSLSDNLLQPLQPYLKQPPIIPSWIDSLPDEKEREEKSSKIEQYGSPNVLGDYEPHVTVGYNNQNTDATTTNRIVMMEEEVELCPTVDQCRDSKGQCQPIVSCFADPCQDSPDDKCNEGEICQPDYCGGCNYQCNEQGSPTLGDEEIGTLRADVMNTWNNAYQTVQGACGGYVLGVGVGKVGEGGTVLSGGRLKYWELRNDVTNMDDSSNELYASVD